MHVVDVSTKSRHRRQLDIRSRKKIIVCEYCGRILIDKYICDYDGSQQKADLEALLDAQKKKGRRLRKSEKIKKQGCSTRQPFYEYIILI